MKLSSRINFLREREPEINTDGENEYCIYRANNPLAERYEIDFSMTAGWLQYDTDQDASYFGVWVNPESLQTLTFAEGDYSLCEHKTAASYNAELARMGEFYAAGFIAKAIDTATGDLTVYQQNRAEFMAQGV